MKYLIQVPRGSALPSLRGQFLQGPRTRAKVKADGYGFTPDVSFSWQFSSKAKAAAKARIVDAHMGWGNVLQVVDEDETQGESSPIKVDLIGGPYDGQTRQTALTAECVTFTCGAVYLPPGGKVTRETTFLVYSPKASEAMREIQGL